MSDRLGIGLYGNFGHQIQGHLIDHPKACLVGCAGFDESALPQALQGSGVRMYDSLAELLADDDVQFVSLCSDNRSEQVGHTLECIRRGRHVYAEKPCAMTEDQLDMILAESDRAGVHFHEMAGSAFEQPYLAMRQLVTEGIIGTVVHVLAQKSYPYHEARPQDEAVDGGLLMQVGVHAVRFVEHVAGIRLSEIEAVESKLGNPEEGDLRMAVSMNGTLENGGVASILANYLNVRSFGSWGNETLRIFGTKGFVEAVDGGARTRCVLEGEDCGSLRIEQPRRHYHDLIFDAILEAKEMPLTLEDELHPTRMVIRAKANAKLNAACER